VLDPWGRYAVGGSAGVNAVRTDAGYTYMHTYIHTYIRTYIHTYIYIYIYRERERERDLQELIEEAEAAHHAGDVR
jgi:hypothetical protein